jgi:hypothetical protein
VLCDEPTAEIYPTRRDFATTEPVLDVLTMDPADEKKECADEAQNAGRERHREEGHLHERWEFEEWGLMGDADAPLTWS